MRLAFVFSAAVLAMISAAEAMVDCGTFPRHTLCLYKGVSQSCGRSPRSGLAASEKRQLLNLHNKLRARVATGQESRGTTGPQPAAADMLEMVWDEELAEVAQRWADQCRFGHDQLRDLPGTRVGQNVYQASRTRDQGNSQLIQDGVHSWFDEVKIFSSRNVDSYNFDSGTGHYTQMVWGATNRLGCGQITYNDGGRFTKKYLVCNYGPAGNFLRRPMYTKGKPCSRCPAGTSCSSNFPGLCSGSGVSSSRPRPQPQRPRPTRPQQTRPAQTGLTFRPLQITRPQQQRPQQPTFVPQRPATTTTTFFTQRPVVATRPPQQFFFFPQQSLPIDGNDISASSGSTNPPSFAFFSGNNNNVNPPPLPQRPPPPPRPTVTSVPPPRPPPPSRRPPRTMFDQIMDSLFVNFRPGGGGRRPMSFGFFL